jgi:hypothetical protein
MLRSPVASDKAHERVAQIFGRLLVPNWKCPNIEIWKAYVNFIQTTKGHQPNGREDILKAFEFALENIGMLIAFQTLSFSRHGYFFYHNLDRLYQFFEGFQGRATFG